MTQSEPSLDKIKCKDLELIHPFRLKRNSFKITFSILGLWIWNVNKIREEIEMREKRWRNNKKRRGESFSNFFLWNFKQIKSSTTFYFWAKIEIEIKRAFVWMEFYSSALVKDGVSKQSNQDINDSVSISCRTAFVEEPKLHLKDILFWHHSGSCKDNDIILKDPKELERFSATETHHDWMRVKVQPENSRRWVGIWGKHIII